MNTAIQFANYPVDFAYLSRGGYQVECQEDFG